LGKKMGCFRAGLFHCLERNFEVHRRRQFLLLSLEGPGIPSGLSTWVSLRASRYKHRTIFTHHYLFLSDPILVVDKSVLFNGITHSNEVFSHFMNEYLSHQALWMLYTLARLEHIFLSLKYAEPGRVELTPESNTIRMERHLIDREA
jgi:hypothetical protein